MSVRTTFLKGVRNVEKKLNIRTTRRKKGYQTFKFWFLLPAMLIVTVLEWLEIKGQNISKYFKQKKRKKLERNPEYKIKITNIIDGFAGLAFPNKQTEEMATKRAEICAGCPHAKAFGAYSVIVDNKTKSIQGMKCDLCGCSLSAKVRSRNDSCPDGKW